MSRPEADICVVTGGHWSAARGGAPFQAHCLAERLAKDKRVRTAYVARTIDVSDPGWSYARYLVHSPRYLHRFGFFVDAPWLYRVLQDIQPKVIYQRGLQAYTGLCAMYARRSGCKFVYHVASDYDVIPLSRHDANIHTGLATIEKRLGEYGLRHADQIIVQSKHQAKLLSENYGLAAAKLVRNFHPEPTRQNGYPRPQTPLEVVWIGNLKPVKRPELFIELAESFADQEKIRFTMIGGGLDTPQYESLRSRVRACKNLVYLGQVGQEHVNSVLDRSHILVCTSRIEGFPNTFIQAWQRGVVVVSLGIDPDEVLADLGIGVLCGDFDVLKSNIANLAIDESKRECIAAQAKQYARDAHSMNNAGELAELLVTLAGV